MSAYSIDVTYAYAQLGLDAGASFEEIEEVLANTRAYRFSTRAREHQILRFLEFFAARAMLGTLDAGFLLIRKAYHKKAMSLHPDRNEGDKEAEEELKLINSAFAIVDAIHREAKEYYRQSETEREEIETEARKTTGREKPPRAKKTNTRQARREEPEEEDEEEEYPRSPRRPAIKYVAASIPRFVRNARLSHLPLNCVISCWYISSENDINLIFDVIMLPEREFMRARMHLSSPGFGNPNYAPGYFLPSYIPQDIKTVTVPPGERNPEKYARDYLLKEFGLENKVG